MKKFLKILLYTFLALLIFIASISFALRFSKVQTYVTQKFTSSLEENLQTKIKIGKIDITWYLNILIEDFEIYDQHQKILFAAESVEVDASLLRLFNDKIKITEAIINNAELNLIVVDGVLNLNYLVEHFKKPKSDTTSNFEIEFIDIELNNFKFTQQNTDKEVVESGFDPNNIQIYFSQIKVNDFFFKGSELGGYFENISAEEKSGLKINKAHGNLLMSDIGLKSDSFYILTDYSELNAIFNWEYESWKSYSDFVNEVDINTSFKNSAISSADLAFFAPALKNTSDLLRIDGEISGSIANFKSKNLILDIDNKLNLKGELKINGLPDIYNSFIMLKINSLETSSTKLNSLSIFQKNDLVMPDQLKNLGNINISGRFTGFYKDFVSNAVFKTKQGTIKTNLLLKPMQDDKVLAYQGQFSTVNFNAGKMLENETLGKITMKADVKGENFDKTAILNTKINISSIGLDGNIYKDIRINGDLANQIFNAEINSKDEKFALEAKATYQILPDHKILNIDMDIDNARISRLVMVNEDTLGNISGDLNINIKGNKLNDFTGEIKFENAVYTYLDKDINHKLEEININSVPFDYGRNIKVRSEFVDADFNIGSELTSLNMVYYDIMENVLPSIFKGKMLSEKLQSKEEDKSILAKINIKNIDLLTKIANINTYISPNTSINAYYSNYKNQLDIKIKGEQIAFNGKELNDYNIHIYSEDDILKLNSYAENFKLSDSIFLDSLIAKSSINGDIANYSIKWGNENPELSALFKGNVSFSDSSITNVFNENYLWINNNLWKIDSTNVLKYSKKDILVNNFIIQSEKSGLFVNGNLNNEGDKLNIKFKKIDLSVVNPVLEKSGTSISGIIDGELSISNPWNDIIINSALKIEKLNLNDTYIGETSIDMEWIDESNAIKTELKALNKDKEIMLVSGNIFPLNSQSNFDLMINLSDLPANAIKPYLLSFSSNIEGFISGDVSLKGKFSSPKLKGFIDADVSKFKIDYLNTEYSFKHRLNIDSTSIKASKVKMYDRLFESEAKGHYATANFEFWFKNSFKDMGVDLNIDANNILALDLEPDMNDFFYGKAFASGKISITGPFDDLLMDVDIETESGTVVSLPYSDKETAENASFINFVNPNDTLSNNGESDIENIFDDSGMIMRFNFKIKPNATLRMVMNERTGDVLTTSGNANLKIDVDKQLNIGMFGTFEVTKGVYNYSFEGIFNKKFNIREGGTISWAGDLMDAKMNLQAIHETNAPLHDLLQFIDSSAVYKRPSRVNAIINIKGRLMNPEISFDIELPDEDENTKELVHNILYISEDQPNTSLINMNFLSLLVLNKFQPPSGFSAQQNAFSSTDATEFLTQQIGNLLGGISNDLDVGIDYKLDNEVTSKQLAVALSYSLLDDRLIINGKFGSGGEAKGSEENRFVGDFLVEYKITQDGNIRARVFNRTNYDDALNKRAPYTQGVGISFTKSVDTFKEIFKKAK